MSQMQKLEDLTDDLILDVQNVRSGKLPIKTAKAVSTLASKAISSAAIVVVHKEHIDLQNRKLKVRQEELAFEKQKLEFEKSQVK